MTINNIYIQRKHLIKISKVFSFLYELSNDMRIILKLDSNLCFIQSTLFD